MAISYPDEALYALLCKYLLHEADEEERRWVEEWLQTDEQHPALLASLEKLLNTGMPPQLALQAQDTETAWQQLNTKMEDMAQQAFPAQWHFDHQLSAKMEDTESISFREIPRRRRVWLAAAILAPLVGIAVWWLAVRQEKAQVFTGPVIAQLKDGSTIQLDSPALVQVLPGFGKKERRVTLRGKALFNVTPDAVHPFIVDLGSRIVKVLGTRFSIDMPAGTGQLTVHVNSGSVLVADRARHDSVLLTTGMLLEQEQDQDTFKVATHVESPEKKRLVFRDTPLGEVLQTISTVYNIPVTAHVSLQELPVTATFSGEPAEDVLAAVALMTNSRVVHRETGIELHPF